MAGAKFYLSGVWLMLSRASLFAASVLVAWPMAAFAQGKITGEGSISPETMPHADSAPAADHNPHVPGATGDAKVPGDPSTISGDQKATADQRTGITAR